MKREQDANAKQASDSSVTLKIPRPLYERLKQVIEGSGFHSVTEFAVYVLRDLVSHHAAQRGAPLPPAVAPPAKSVAEPATGADAEPEVQPLSLAEIEAIRKRLESLGYL